MRQPRRDLADGFAFFHGTSRGVAQMTLFHDRGDYVYFRSLLFGVVVRFRWTLHTYCLMPNHYHLVLAALRADLSAGMHRLNGLYAMAFNHRYERLGHVFQNRFGARLIEDETQLERTCEYVLANPVRAGLVQTPDAWPWSGRGEED